LKKTLTKLLNSFRKKLFLTAAVLMLSIYSFAPPLKVEAATDLSPVALDNSDFAKFEGDKVDYDSEKEVFTIDGSAVVYMQKDGMKLSADRIEYYSKEDLIKAYGNVLITGNEQVTFAEYLEIKLDTNTAKLINPQTQMAQVDFEAEEGTLKTKNKAKDGDFKNGDFDMATPVRFGSSGAGLPSYRILQNLNDTPEKILENGQSFSLEARKIIYTPDRIQNNVQIIGGKLKFKKIPVSIPVPYFPLTAGDSTQQMFGMVLGNTPQTGAGDFNYGPKFSFVLGDPKKERAFSFAPFGQANSRTGFGGMIEYTDPRNSALLAYGSAKDRGLAEVTSRITKYDNFRYGWNSYMGGGITKQFIQLQDERRIKIPVIGTIFTGDSINLNSDVAYIVDSQRLRQEENNRISRLQEGSLGNFADTPDRRGVRLQQTLFFETKPLLEIGTDNYHTGISIGSSSTARYYSTGNINAFTTVGPILRTHLHRLADFDIGYSQLLTAGRSPFGFDQVIQGNESVTGNGDLNILPWLTIGGFGTYSISRRTWVAQQARLVIGPEDFKILIGYDPVFRRVNFGFTMFFDDKVNFKRFAYHDRGLAKKRRF
jgi:lipopolysaccharide export system protein LptA